MTARSIIASGTACILAALCLIPRDLRAQGAGATSLRERYRAAAEALANTLDSKHKRLDLAYLDKLASFEGTASAPAAAAERSRFKAEGGVPAEGQRSADPEVANLQELFASAAERLDKEAAGAPAALASSYLFRLCAAGENAFASAEHERLAGAGIDFEASAHGRTDLVPEADAFVRSGAHGEKNYGALDHLMVRQVSQKGSTSRVGLLRFDIARLGRGEVEDARVRLVCTGNYKRLRVPQRLKVGGDRRFSESGVTFETRPTIGTPIAEWEAPDQGAVVYIDVTRRVNAAIAARETSVQFVLTGGDAYVTYGSRENANPWARPVLMVNDAGAAMARDAGGALPAVEVFGRAGGGAEPAPAPATEPQVARVELAAAPEKDLALKGSIKQVNALLVREVGGGGMAGFAQPLTATAVKSGGAAGMEITFNQEVGDEMRAALAAAVRGLQIRYGAWPHGYTAELGFEEKYNPKDGPSAAVACALLLDGLVNDHAFDPGFAVTGDLNSDLSVQPVGGVPAKIRGATNRGASVICVPAANRRELVDLVIAGELKPLFDVAVFTAEKFDDARDLALAERPPQLAASLDEFAALQAAGLAAMRDEESIAKLRAILGRSPNFLSAELVLRAATRTLPPTLSLAGSFEAIDTNIAPFIAAIRLGKSEKINDTELASTMESLRLIAPKLDARVRPLHTALIDLLVFDRRHVDKTFTNEAQYRAALAESRTLIRRYDAARTELAENPEIVEELSR